MILLRGEASFLVAKHDSRPFIVQARDVSVRAVGTSFAVTMRPTTVSVTVDEGVVEIARVAEGGQPSERRQLTASRKLTAVPARPIETAALSRGEMTRQLAWRDGLLIFDGELLQQATEQVNRYSNVPVEIDDAVLQNKHFFGVFRTGDARAFAYAVAGLFDAQVNEERGTLHVMPK
jgi:transmembrane sensor